MLKNHGVITYIAEDAASPYLLDNRMCWVNDGDIRGQYNEDSAPTPATIGIGDSVKVQSGVCDYNGNSIAKKVCMWLLVAVGAVLDWLLSYAGDKLGMTIHLPMLIASLVAVWLICNELISILENIGVPLPGFLGRLVSMLKSKVDSQVPDNSSDQK
ncbi:phage holin family protein [Caproicibacterium sp. NSD3]